MSEVVEAGTQEPKQVLNQNDYLERERKLAEHADYISKASILPDRFYNKPHNVYIACKVAESLNIEPFEAMQKIFIIKGNASIHSSFAIALANTRALAEPIDYEWKEEPCDVEILGVNIGTNTKVRAFGVLKKTGKKVYGPWYSYADALQTGNLHSSDGKLKPVWRGNKMLMLSYKAASAFIKTACPEVLSSLDVHAENQMKTANRVEQSSSEVKQKVENLLEVEEVKS